MSRYIDADRFECFCTGVPKGVNADSFCRGIDEVLYAIDNAPTIDAVEVVRCGECVHHKDAPKTDDVWCENLDGLLPREWFCKDGEKGEDEKTRSI